MNYGKIRDSSSAEPAESVLAHCNALQDVYSAFDALLGRGEGDWR